MNDKTSRWNQIVPIVVLALCVLYVGSSFRGAKDSSAFELSEFGRLPVVDLGRIKPIDTLARTSLMVLSNKQTMFLKEGGGTSDRDRVDGHAKVPALRWLMDVMTKPTVSRDYEVLRIDHPDVLSVLHADRDRKYFSVNEVLAQREAISEQIRRAREARANDRTPYQRQVLRLAQSLDIYFSLEDVFNLHLIPPPSDTNPEGWQTFAEAQHQADEHGEADPALTAYPAMFKAWVEDDPDTFNATVASYRASLDERIPKIVSTARFESSYNHAAPFVRSMALYVLIFLLAALSWLKMSQPLLRSALWVLGLTLILHTFGLVARIYIQGRPPVTNLYSSAIFVGWGAVVLGLILERFYRNGIGSVTAAGTGFLTLLVAHNLSLDGDTMTMMQAVLDTNFWLATHVVVITLGYAATFLAGFLGILYVFRGVFTRGLTTEMGRNLSRMIYGIVCFAALFSFVGTILGGIWADQSWGRFWGWDPKENGALLIVLWNALVLHARWGGMVRQRGVAVLAIAGNIVTSWSWFGTNMLGVGLHAYGFIDSAVFWMLAFVASQLLIIGIGMLPLHYWRSMRTTTQRPAQRPAPRAPDKDLPPLPDPSAAKSAH